MIALSPIILYNHILLLLYCYCIVKTINHLRPFYGYIVIFQTVCRFADGKLSHLFLKINCTFCLCVQFSVVDVWIVYSCVIRFCQNILRVFCYAACDLTNKGKLTELNHFVKLWNLSFPMGFEG